MEHVIRFLGMDLGNSVTKVVAGWNKSQANWAEVPTEVAKVATWTPGADARLDESLYVRFKSHAVAADSWLVGKAAMEGDIPSSRPGKGTIKVDTPELFIAGLAAIGLLCINRFRLNSRTGEATIRINLLATSLPWGQFNDGNKEAMRQKLRGAHALEFPNLPRLGSLKLNLVVERVVCSPEGMPALMAQAYEVNRDDQLTAARPDLVQAVIGVIDVGGGTTDILLFDPRFRLIRGSCDTLNYGINDALRKAHATLLQQRWEIRFPTVAALVDHIRRGEVEIKGKGDHKIHLIRDYLEEHLISIAGSISSEINQRWSTAVQRFFMVGGGAVVLEPYLTLGESRPETPRYPEWQNAVGNYIVGRLALGERAV